MAWLTRWPMRRWFRVLWCILAAACLGGLPWIITEFTRADFSIHYQVSLSAWLCSCGSLSVWTQLHPMQAQQALQGPG